MKYIVLRIPLSKFDIFLLDRPFSGIYKGNFPIIAAGQLLMEREGEYSNCKLDI